MKRVNILLLRDHEDGTDLIADYFADPKWMTHHTMLVSIACKIAASGNKQGITRVVLIHDPAKTAYYVIMDDVTTIGYTGEFKMRTRRMDEFELAHEQPWEKAKRLEREREVEEDAADHEYQQQRDDELEQKHD